MTDVLTPPYLHPTSNIQRSTSTTVKAVRVQYAKGCLKSSLAGPPSSSDRPAGAILVLNEFIASGQLVARIFAKSQPSFLPVRHDISQQRGLG
jgi:hypothetical protein